MDTNRRSILTAMVGGVIFALLGGNQMARLRFGKIQDDSATPAASPAATPAAHTGITITFGDVVVQGELWDNPTARDLVSLLPLELVFSDYNSVEKTASLPRALTMNGVPAGADPEPSDIGYYAPGNVLVLYYGDVGYWNGIVRLGRMLDNGEGIVAQTSDFTARIEIATDEVKSEATP